MAAHISRSTARPSELDGVILVCAWCPDFNSRARCHANTSHGICAACAEKLERENDRRVQKGGACAS